MSKELDSLANSKNISFCVRRGDSFKRANLLYVVKIPLSAYRRGLEQFEFDGLSWEEAEASARQYLEGIEDKK